MKSWTKMVVILLVIIALLAIALWQGFRMGKRYEDPKNNSVEKHQAGFRYISPLLECENNYRLNYNYNSLKSKLENLISDKIRNKEAQSIAIYFRDLNNGPWISINGEEKFSPASLLKVPLMIAYLKMAETQPDLLKQKLIIPEQSETLIIQNILPVERVEPGQEYEIENLITRMIKYSDNAAAGALLNNIQGEELDRIYYDLGINVPGQTEMENFMSVTDYAAFFRILYNASYLNRAMSEKALEIMSKTDFVKGIKSKLPANVPVSHKFGERIFEEKKQLHDCGIIYLEENSYLFCVMTRGENFNLMENAIADLSKEVFNSMKSFTKK